MVFSQYEDRNLPHRISLSFGKDSLCMLFMLVEKGIRIDEAVFYNTGMEYKAIYAVRDMLLPFFARNNIKYTELYPKEDFQYKMFKKTICSKNGDIHSGYSWCGGICRWGTRDKISALEKYNKDGIDFVGIASDEPKRIKKKKRLNKQYLLYEWGVTEKMALEYCYSKGIFWEENGIRLYEILDRVSCYCCKNKNLKELRNIFHYLPQYWEQLKDFQKRTVRPFRSDGKTIFDLENRFILEDMGKYKERIA